MATRLAMSRRMLSAIDELGSSIPTMSLFVCFRTEDSAVPIEAHAARSAPSIGVPKNTTPVVRDSMRW